MDLLIAEGSVPFSSADVPPVSGTPQYATDGNPPSVLPTIWPSYWFNGLARELVVNLVQALGLTPDRTLTNQIYWAIARMAGSSFTTVTADSSLTASAAGTVVINATANNVTITLPQVASAGGKRTQLKFIRIDNSGHTVTLQEDAGDSVWTLGSSFTMAPLSTEVLIGDGGTNWLPSRAAIMNGYLGAGALAGYATEAWVGAQGFLTSANFTGSNQSLGDPGYQKLPGGLILQWGGGNAPIGSPPQYVDVTFPVTFPTAALRMLLGGQSSGPPGVGYSDLTNGGARLWTNGGGGEAIDYMVLGH